MGEGDEDDRANLKAIYGLLFFGVPNHGMSNEGIKSFVAMVEDQPNRYLVETLQGTSEVLREQCDKFPDVFHFMDSEIVSFYETEKSPTAKQVSFSSI